MSNAPAPGADAGGAGASSAAPARVPTNHRPSGETCSQDRPAGVSPDLAQHFPGDCKKDADCTAGKNGRCSLEAFSKLACTYDECFADGDCHTGVCSCRSEQHYSANVCFHGDCVTDVDCAGWYCSPSGTTISDNCLGGVPAGSFGYYCHTPADECIDDADCKGALPNKCAFKADVHKWACLKLSCTH